MTIQESDIYTLRPITQWPGPLTAERVASAFKAPWERTLDLLDRELWFLGAKNTVLQVAITEMDLRKNGQIRASAKPEHPGVVLSFEGTFGSMQYPCDKFDDWQDNVRAIALALEALRKVDRYGISNRGQQYTGWLALEDKTMNRQEAEELIRRYGGEAEALRRTHPDQGGKREEFDRVMEARRLLRGA